MLQWGAGQAELEAREGGRAARRTRTTGCVATLCRGRALLGAAAAAGAAQRDHLGQGRHGGREAVRGRAQPLHHRQDQQHGSLSRRRNEKDQAVLAYVQALRNYWTAYYHLRRVTLYDFALKQPMSEERQK